MIKQGLKMGETLFAEPLSPPGLMVFVDHQAFFFVLLAKTRTFFNIQKKIQQSES